jgi:hypothetical protein
MRRGASVVDAVSAGELVHVAAELELDVSAQDDEQLFGVAVRVRLRARRAAHVELADEDFEVIQRPRREQQLAAEDAECERRAFVASKNAWPRWTAGLEQIRDADAERGRDPAERGDARAGLAAFDLTEKALADRRAVGNRLERGAPQATEGAKPLTDVDFRDCFRRARGQ